MFCFHILFRVLSCIAHFSAFYFVAVEGKKQVELKLVVKPKDLTFSEDKFQGTVKMEAFDSKPL